MYKNNSILQNYVENLPMSKLTFGGKMASGGDVNMAKRQKVEEDEVSGYIHEVSPVKTSARNTKYFDAKLQIESDVYQKMVCFDPSKHSHFVEAHHGKSPLKIIGIREVINRENNQNTDVLVNAR
jgi:hypothetical protein